MGRSQPSFLMEIKAMPQRFSRHEQKKLPRIHRAPLGRHERFIGFLIESRKAGRATSRSGSRRVRCAWTRISARRRSGRRFPTRNNGASIPQLRDWSSAVAIPPGRDRRSERASPPRRPARREAEGGSGGGYSGGHQRAKGVGKSC